MYKDQSGLSYHLHYRETCEPALSEHAQTTTFGLLAEASLFRLTGWFHIHLFLYKQQTDQARMADLTVTYSKLEKKSPV